MDTHIIRLSKLHKTTKNIKEKAKNKTFSCVKNGIVMVVWCIRTANAVLSLACTPPMLKALAHLVRPWDKKSAIKFNYKSH